VKLVRESFLAPSDAGILSREAMQNRFHAPAHTMNLEELQYDLPAERIAQTPAEVRDQSRLMVLDRTAGTMTHHRFRDLPTFLRSGDVLVLNETRVIRAKFSVTRASGGRIEGLFLSEPDPGTWAVMLKPSRRLRVGEILDTGHKSHRLVLTESLGGGRWRLRPDPPHSAAHLLEQIGTTPLPPYIKRAPADTREAEDRKRYQTVYATNPGSVAAPTAGMHFTRELLHVIEQAGITIARLTLQVGLGTFQPVTAKRLEDHPMHREAYELPAEATATINDARQAGGRIVAIGTTSVRVLETCADDQGNLGPAGGSTDLLIAPPYKFRAVDALVTNFHLPGSTLLALVYAFAGREKILDAYEEAIRNDYRFYSYGDAMLIV